MAVPSSGPVSFTVIANNLPFLYPPPYSLNAMSVGAGFTTPDAVSEFYGYPTGITPFFRTLNAGGNPPDECFQPCDQDVYHNGTGLLPAVGDTVYNDPGGLQPLAYSGYWGMSDTLNQPAPFTFEVDPNNSGVVINKFQC
jgi:hypothetical protein